MVSEFFFVMGGLVSPRGFLGPWVVFPFEPEDFSIFKFTCLVAFNVEG